MRIAFIDVAKWDYTIDTPYRVPLGGSQSALCYLAEQLAALGHDVRLFNSTSQVTVSRGVTCAPLTKVSNATWKDLDVVIVQNWAKIGLELRPMLRADARLFLWTQHADDQPAMHALADPAIREAFHGVAFVSDWQRQRYHEAYQLQLHRSFVLRNAIAPTFENPFPNGDVLAAKTNPPVLAYTSTPFRGLEILLDVFPRIRAAVPEVRLQVFSSMQVYQMSPDRDAATYGQLYERCRSTLGVEYVGSLPQPELAKELTRASMLAYPNNFPETSCIAVMEAMASGCHVVTSALGALPETTAGFATLIAVDNDWKRYRDQFVEGTVRQIRRAREQPDAANCELARQVDWINQECTWRNRSLEWQALLEA